MGRPISQSVRCWECGKVFDPMHSPNAILVCSSHSAAIHLCGPLCRSNLVNRAMDGRSGVEPEEGSESGLDSGSEFGSGEIIEWNGSEWVPVPSTALVTHNGLQAGMYEGPTF